MNFYQDQNKWKHNLIPIQVSKNEAVIIIDSLTNKNHYALVIKMNVLSGDHHKNFICTRRSNSYTSEKMVKIYIPRCENCDITTIGPSSDCHLHWKNLFHKNPFYFRTIGDFDADNEIDNSSICNKTANFYKKKSSIQSL